VIASILNDGDVQNTLRIQRAALLCTFSRSSVGNIMELCCKTTFGSHIA